MDNDIPLFSNKSLLTEQNYHIKDNILFYISGFIVRKVIAFVDCSNCLHALNEPAVVHNYSLSASFAKFVCLKNRGGLVRASKSTFDIVQATENALIVLTDNFKDLQVKNIKSKVIMALKRKYMDKAGVFMECSNCEVNIFEKSHKLNLIELVANKYLNIRLLTYARHHSLEIINPPTKRQKYNKLVLLSNM